MSDTAKVLQDIKRSLDDVKVEITKAEVRFEDSITELRELGYASIEEAEQALKKMAVKLNKKIVRLQKDTNIFLKEYEEVLNEELSQED